MSRLRNFWPEIRDAESAQVAARQGFQVAAIVAAVDAVAGLIILAGVKVGPFDAWILFDVRSSQLSLGAPTEHPKHGPLLVCA